MSDLASGPLPTLRVQTVLFENPLGQLERHARSLAQAVGLARQRGALSTVSVAWGDCSPLPVADDAVDELLKPLRDSGVDRTDYRFLGANLGHSGGHEALLVDSDSDLVLFCNPDTTLSPTTLVELLEPLSQPMVGMVEARQLPLEHPKAYDPQTMETGWCSLACCLVRRSALAAAGGLDGSSFFLYADDVDLSWRIRLAGYRCMFRPTARVFHDKRPDLDGAPLVTPVVELYEYGARLMLMHKFADAELLQAELDALLAAGGEATAAANDFLDRKTSGALPRPVPGGSAVALFDNGRYAEHRW